MIEMNKITMQKDGTLSVPDVPVVPYITGDGVGAEVTPSMQAVVNAAVQKAYGGKRRIEWKEVLAGERAFNETGSWLPDETMKAFQEYLIGIKGPLRSHFGVPPLTSPLAGRIFLMLFSTLDRGSISS